MLIPNLPMYFTPDLKGVVVEAPSGFIKIEDRPDRHGVIPALTSLTNVHIPQFSDEELSELDVEIDKEMAKHVEQTERVIPNLLPARTIPQFSDEELRELDVEIDKEMAKHVEQTEEFNQAVLEQVIPNPFSNKEVRKLDKELKALNPLSDTPDEALDKAEEELFQAVFISGCFIN